MRHVILFYFLRTSSVGGGEGALPDILVVFSFLCSADPERDWPPCKVVFGLATNTLNVRNNNNKNHNLVIHMKLRTGKRRDS